MTNPRAVSDNYRQTGLLDAIVAGLAAEGKTPATATVEDLAPVDEFHVGGRDATRALLDQLDIQPEHNVLDIGCGIGGAARFAATTYGCRVTGIDITEEYVDAGNALSAFVGCDASVRLEGGDVMASDHDGASFHKAYMLHVGMNIARKQELAAEVFRLLEPGGAFGIYDLMRVGDGELEFPVPWATSPATSTVSTPRTLSAW